MASEITAAVLKNDLSAIKKLCTAANINKPDEEGLTPLYVAAMRTSVQPAVISELLRLGAQVDAKGTDDETPFYIAVFNGREDVADTLLQAKADVNQTNGKLKETALHVAARLGSTSLTTYLLKHKADINARNSKQETPLFSAAKMGRHETVFLLLEAGANATIPDLDGKTPLYIASEKGFKHVVVVLKADAKDLRHAKAEADVELRQLPAPFMSSAEMVDRANKDKTFSEQLRRGSVPQAAAPNLEPMEVVEIKVPQPKQRTHDPLTGASYGPCRTLEEVGYDAPPEIPKELQNRPPAKLPRVGGTSMVVNTEDGAKKPVSVNDLNGEPETEFFVAARK